MLNNTCKKFNYHYQTLHDDEERKDMQTQLIKILLIPILLFACGNVWCADFTFKIPFQLTKLHDDVRQIQIQCNLFSTTNPSGQGRAWVFKRVNVSNNRLQSTVTVEVNATDPNYPPEDLKSYSCHFKVSKGSETKYMEAGDNIEAWRRIRPGTQFVHRRQGTL